MAEPGALMPVFDVGIRSAVVADAIEEVLLVGRLHGLLLVAGFDAVLDMPAAIVEHQDAALAIELHAPRLAGDANERPDAVLPQNRAVGEVEGGQVSVGSFLVVVVEELAAAGANADRGVEIEHPTSQIESMNAVVAQFAGAVVPVPMPLVMEAIGVEGALRRRAEPQIVI